MCILNNRNHTEDVEVQVESRPRYKNASNETQYPIALSTRIVNSEPDFANSEYRSEIALVTSWPSLVFLGRDGVIVAESTVRRLHFNVEMVCSIHMHDVDTAHRIIMTAIVGIIHAYTLASLYQFSYRL